MFVPCTVCHKVTKNKCYYCDKVYYCSDKCRKSDFKFHRESCSKMNSTLIESNLTMLIPKNVYQTWNTKALPYSMKRNRDSLMTRNPDMNFFLFDDKDCANFIKTNFPENVFLTFCSLLPGAYRADLWRYCVLYIHGGIYMDIKFNPLIPLHFFLSEEIFVLDQPYKNSFYSVEDDLKWRNHPNYINDILRKNVYKNHMGIYNGFLVTQPKNKFLKQCIDSIVRHVQQNYYGHNSLYPTGPGLLGDIFFHQDYIEKLKQTKYFLSRQGKHILNKDQVVLSIYPSYRSEQKSFGTPHYSYLWDQRKIYKRIRKK